MNDLLFMIVEENLRPANTIANQPDLWFVFIPNTPRVALTHYVSSKTGLNSGQVPFLVARFLTLCVFP